MTAADLQALAPLIVLAATAVAVLIAIAARRNHALAFALTLAGLGAAIVLAATAWNAAPRRVGELLIVDQFTHFYLILIAFGAGVTAMFSHGYLEKAGSAPYPAAGSPSESPSFSARRKEEFYVLLLLATTGAVVLSAAAHFASFFLGLELLTVPLYALIAYRRRLSECIEAGVKYLVLAGAASAVLLFGMALVYAQTGTMQISEAVTRATGASDASADTSGGLAAAGMAMILAAIGFKLALVPFHLWAADVYEGAPAPVSGFLATVSKGAVFALLLRHFASPALAGGGALPVALAVIAAASMLAGNLLALRQQNLKRILAYSSIAHMGYLLTAFLAGGSSAGQAVTFYLVAYFVTSLGAFGVLAAVSGPGRDAGSLEDLRGLMWRRPALGGVLAAMLLSLAGIPLTAGFMGKLLVLGAGVGASLWALAGVLCAGSVIGAYYYLRVIVVLCRTDTEESPGATAALSSSRAAPPDPAAWLQTAQPRHPEVPASPLAASIALTAMAALLLGLGAYPGPVIALIQELFAH